MATARSSAIALTALLEELAPRECSGLRRSLLPVFMAVEWVEGFVRAAVSENLVGDCVSCQAVRALFAPAIPQASNDIMMTVEK
jgi:hypothetical protein